MRNLNPNFNKISFMALAITGGALIAYMVWSYGNIAKSKTSIKTGKVLSNGTPANNIAKPNQPSNQQVTSINGLLVEASKVKRPFAVVVENHVDSRQQSGLSQADIVYEALAEGGITRYLAVYQTQEVATIGPVRSARTYFNDWAQELRAVYAHVGGNSDALHYIKKGIPGVSDADQYYNDPFFWRSKDRKAPHNTYTSTANLKRLTTTRKYTTEKTYPDWSFKDEKTGAQASGTVKQIDIDFSLPQFAVRYTHDASTNTYKRFLAGKADLDRNNGKQLSAKTIIVQRVKNWPVESDTPLSISMGTREGGDAQIFLDGKEIKATWKMMSDGRSRFYTLTGEEVQLNRGQIWVEIVPPDKKVSVK